MCLISKLLLPNVSYVGAVVRMHDGHIFYACGVYRLLDGTLVPTGIIKSVDDHSFYLFRRVLLSAIEHSTHPDAGVFAEDFSGDRNALRERILDLNRQYGLPGFAAKEEMRRNAA